MILYLSSTSWLHRWPAGLKLFGLVSLGTMMTAFGTLMSISIVLALLILVYTSLGRAVLPAIKSLSPLLILISLLFVVQSWLSDWATAALISVRMLSLVLLAQLITLTTRLTDMLAALLPLFSPLRHCGIAPERIAFTVALVIRFIPVLLAHYSALRSAWQARGGRYRSWILLSPLLVQSLRLTEQIAMAVAARGGIPNTQPHENMTHE